MNLKICLSSILLVALSVTITYAETGKYQIGVSCPLSGDLAEYGAAVRNGIEFAVEQEPNRFSKLAFIYEDNQYHSAKAVSALNKLQYADEIDLLYNWGEPTLHAIAPIVEKSKLPVVAMSLDPEPAISRKYIVRSINYSEQYAIKLLEYLRSKNFKKLGIIKTEDPFLNSMISGLEKNLKAGEKLDVLVAVLPEDTDFKSYISKMKNTDYDAIGVYLFTGQVSAFYRQASALKLNKPTFGTDFFESKTEIKDAQGKMDGAVYPNIAVPQDFADAYLKKYGNDNQIAYAFNAYTFAKLASDIFGKQQGELDGDMIIDLFTKSLPSSVSEFAYKDTKDGGKFYQFNIVVKQIEGNEIKTVM